MTSFDTTATTLITPAAATPDVRRRLTHLRAQKAGEVLQRRGHSCRIVLSRDAVRHVVCRELDQGPVVRCVHSPRHRHGARIRRVVRDEVDCLDHSVVPHDVDKSGLDDVGVGRALRCTTGRIVVGQDQPVGATRCWIESFESPRHPGVRQPRLESDAIDECVENATQFGADDSRGAVPSSHLWILRRRWVGPARCP